MAILQCKMCGGTLELHNGSTIAVCEYCGTKQTLPHLLDDRRTNLYNRANHLRQNNEYDKAAALYEQLVGEDETDAEAYWALVLCRYGIEYVEEPSGKRIPTVNRMQYMSILEDANYKSALQYADEAQKAIYQAEARTINEIQKNIQVIANKETPFDVFICYKETDEHGRRTPDSVLANELYHLLTEEGYKVFFSRITLEDKLGVEYEPYIFAALQSAKVMVVMGTKKSYFEAVWVKNEWSRYLALIQNGAKKILIPAYRDMDPYDLPDEFAHLQAQDMSKLGFLQDLVRGIQKLTAFQETSTEPKKAFSAPSRESVDALLKRVFLFLEEGNWPAANEYCEKVLDTDPERAEAYLGKLMTESRAHRLEELVYATKALDLNPNFKNAVRFADETLKNTLISYNDSVNKRLQAEQETLKRELRKGKRKRNLFAIISIVIVEIILIFTFSEEQIISKIGENTHKSIFMVCVLGLFVTLIIEAVLASKLRKKQVLFQEIDSQNTIKALRKKRRLSILAIVIALILFTATTASMYSLRDEEMGVLVAALCGAEIILFYGAIVLTALYTKKLKRQRL